MKRLKRKLFLINVQNVVHRNPKYDRLKLNTGPGNTRSCDGSDAGPFTGSICLIMFVSASSVNAAVYCYITVPTTHFTVYTVRYSE